MQILSIVTVKIFTMQQNSFELAIHQKIMYQEMFHTFHKNIKQHNCFQTDTVIIINVS